jgi:X breakpoint 2-interacting protein
MDTNSVMERMRASPVAHSVCTRKSHQLDTTRLLNTVHRLLQLHRSGQAALDQLRTSLQRSKSDVTMQLEIGERLKDDLRATDKELATSQEKERQLNIKIKSLSAKLRTEQDEVRRLKTSMQYKEAQHSHEMRKREKEYSRLKVKLGQLVSDRSHERRLGLSVLNALQRSGGKRKLWDQPGSSVEGTYRTIVSSYEERQKVRSSLS